MLKKNSNFKKIYCLLDNSESMQINFKYYMKKVIFIFKIYSLDDLDNVQIIIQIFLNLIFEKKNYVLKKNYIE